MKESSKEWETKKKRKESKKEGNIFLFIKKKLKEGKMWRTNEWTLTQDEERKKENS